MSIFIVWAVMGLLGGILINRTEKINLATWPIALVLGPITLLLGIWEWATRRTGRYEP